MKSFTRRNVPRARNDMRNSSKVSETRVNGNNASFNPMAEWLRPTGRFRLLRNASGRPHYVFSFNEDITQRRRAEEERNRLTQRMQLLLDSTGQGIYGVDPQGNCTFVNRATCEMIGYRSEEILGRNMHELVHHHKPDGSPYPVDECSLYRAIRTGEGGRGEDEVIWRRDGTA